MYNIGGRGLLRRIMKRDNQTEERIKRLREISGLNRIEFAKKYEIPIRTLTNWERPKSNSDHRDCPEYVLKLLERVVIEDFKEKQQ